ncbi:unnamed protein product, partial [Prunus brigantina]
MTSEAPESTSPVTITETEPTVRSSASEPIITERTAESVQEQAVVENLMDKQAYRIETSFMAAMDRLSSELRTLFQERMPTSASTTPTGAGRRSQESERLEPYGEGSSHGTPARAPTSGYGQNFQPPTNGWGHPMNSTAQHGGPVHTLAVHTHLGASNTPVASSQQYGQSNPVIPSLQTPLFSPDSHLHYGAADIDRTPLPRNYRLPEFTLFSGDGHTSSIEHIGRFTAQCGEADSDAHKLRLFVHSLTGAAFSWFINLPPNSVRDWSDMERTFHEHFYQTNREITVAELARMSQATDESPRDYLQRFKTCRNWCRTSLPEREFVKMAEEGLDYAEADGPTEAESEGVEVSSAEVKIDEPFICKGLVKTD